MISQKCPKCDSARVRRGYRPTPVLMRIIGRYHLLCDNCNWEFTGFAVPGTTTSKPTRRPRTEAEKAAKKAAAEAGTETGSEQPQ